MSFPSLSVKPVSDGWSESAATDPTIRSTAENGSIVTRPRYTGVPRQWKIRYTDLTLTDKNTLQAFEVASNYGSAIFSWTSPADGNTYQVRFGQLLEFVIMPENPVLWSVNITLVEAL